MKNLSKLVLFILLLSFNGCTENQKEIKIESPSIEQLKGIVNGLNDKSILIQNAVIVKSDDFENIYFFGAKLNSGQIGVWSIGGTKNEINIIMSINDVAKQFSEYPQNNNRINMNDHGAKEVEQYLIDK